MPELPEVEQVRKSLTPHITGKKILEVELRLPRLVKYPEPERFISELAGKTIAAVARRGKYLVLQLASGQQLIVHLRMTGALIAQKSELPPPSHAQIRFTLSGGVTMWFSDIRTFGTLYLITENDFRVGGYETLGPEPLSAAFTAEYLRRLAARSRKAVKTFILDQTVIAGLGNIYADESLALAGISPLRPANSLEAAEVEALYAAINAAIAQGIRNRGTTFRDYKDGEGKSRENQKYLLVYGRGGQACKKCGAALLHTKVGGRGTTYCGHCQK